MLASALAMAALAPAFHYHQFGEPTRMARDAGVSALLAGGLAMVLTGAVKSFRRDIESGTAAVCLSHGVSRRAFFLAKFAGLLAAYGFFALTVAAVSTVVVNGAAIGGALARANGTMATVWGPSLVLALSALLLPLAIGAALNRFFGCRFVLTAQVAMLVLALAGVVYRFDPALCLGHLGQMVRTALPTVAYTAMAAAYACRFRLNVAGALTALTVALQLPFMAGWAILPGTLAFLYLGVVLFDECDIA